MNDPAPKVQERMDRNPEIETLLLEAFRREGIKYPPERLDDAVEDCAHLQAFLERIRTEARHGDD